LGICNKSYVSLPAPKDEALSDAPDSDQTFAATGTPVGLFETSSVLCHVASWIDTRAQGANLRNQKKKKKKTKMSRMSERKQTKVADLDGILAWLASVSAFAVFLKSLQPEQRITQMCKFLKYSTQTFGLLYRSFSCHLIHGGIAKYEFESKSLQIIHLSEFDSKSGGDLPGCGNSTAVTFA
jgi:hypothetical protein